VVNRWHKHALDQVDFPLALRQIFGEGGLNQTGLSLDWAMPTLWGRAQGLTVQLTEGENDRLFGSNSDGNPSVLVHYKNFRDLSKDTYLELGATGLIGWNDEWPVESGEVSRTEDRDLATRVFGLDCSLLWEPTDRMRYRNVEWRSELYWLNRELLAPDATGRDTLNAWGAYSYVQTKLNRQWNLGIRGDYYHPDNKSYATTESLLAPLAYPDNDTYLWQVGPYITWDLSPFVRLRLEYDHLSGHGSADSDDIVWFQLVFSGGPHKHERY